MLGTMSGMRCEKVHHVPAVLQDGGLPLEMLGLVLWCLAESW